MYGDWLPNRLAGDEDENNEDGNREYGLSSISQKDEEKITEHDIVKHWRFELRAMSKHLSAIFSKSFDQPSNEFFRQMGINTDDGIKKWFAACNMIHHNNFHFYTTNTALSTDIEEFVKPRLKYILCCLKTIKGDHRLYIHKKYILPWQEAIDDKWLWTSLLDKWRLQFNFMRYDLIKRFGSEEAVQDYIGGSKRWVFFQSFLELKDTSFDEPLDEDQEFCYQDYCTNVNRVVSFVQYNIEYIIELLIRADCVAYAHDYQKDFAYWISNQYIKPFTWALRDSNEWEKLIGVGDPLTNWMTPELEHCWPPGNCKLATAILLGN